MSLLPAVIPEIPESRSAVVPARVARKVAPLFGVAWPAGPFGSRTWVSDYGEITLSEIARGAPAPERSTARRLRDAEDGPWRIVDRFAVPPRAALPNEIPNATLTRFGPDTKAAVVLTAANVLLAPVTEAVEQALPLIVGQPGELPVELRLAAWAGMVLEVFRSQPTLLAAAIRARTIQRELLVSWRLPAAGRAAELKLARCEIATDALPVDRTPDPDRPATLAVADRTIRALQVLTPDADGVADSADLTYRLLRDETVDLLLRRLLSVGTPTSSSYLWLSERAPDQLVVEALVPATPVVDRFVGQALRSLGGRQTVHDAGAVLPVVPSRSALQALPVLARRAALIGMLGMLRYVQNSAPARDRTRAAVVPVLDELGALLRGCLAADDPVGVLGRCRIADMRVQTLRPDATRELREPVAELRAAVRAVYELCTAGGLDRGAAAEAIASANVELNAVRRTNAEDRAAGLPAPVELYREIRENWGAYLAVLQITDPLQAPAAGYHLHNYAAFLASPSGSDAEREADLQAAYRLFTGVVLRARGDFFADTGAFGPLRTTLLMTARATTGLAELNRARGDGDAARRWAAEGLDLIQRALADEDTDRLRAAAPPTEKAARMALLAVPPLLTALELGVPAAQPDDLRTARDLLDLARGWEARLPRGSRAARHDERAALAARLSALSARFGSGRQGEGDR